MNDIALEIIRALILTIIVVYLWYVGNKADLKKTPGWRYLVIGFALILFGAYIDITDNFESLNRFVWLGDTDEQAFLEKVVGYTAGFSFLAYGLWLWLPSVIQVKTQRLELIELTQQLKTTINELEKANKETLEQIAKRIKTEKAKQHLALQLQQSHRLDALSRLAGSMAHDFNNLLASILGYVDMSKLALKDKSEHTAMYIDEALLATEKARDFIQQILLFSERNVADLNPKPITSLIDQAVHLVDGIKEHDVELIYHCHLSNDTLIQADPVQFNQLLLNLIRNGIEAMATVDRERRLTINACITTLKTDHHYANHVVKAGPCVELTISDTGTGIEAETLNHMFEPYFSTRDKGRGVGLGLSVVHGIVKSHGGALEVSTQLDQGTTVKLLFPLIDHDSDLPNRLESSEPVTDEMQNPSANPASDQSIAIHPSPDDSTKRILFVDDEPGIITLMEKVFATLGYQASTYLNPLEALSAFQAQPDAFNLVILDQQMPHLLGTELAEKIHTIRPDLPIILHTGQLLDKKTLQFDQLGICELIPKPLKVSAFGQVLGQILNKT